jgi:hypothetical protein
MSETKVRGNNPTKQSPVIMAKGRILYSPALESMHPMPSIAGDHQDRPYDAMADIDHIGCIVLSPHANMVIPK